MQKADFYSNGHADHADLADDINVNENEKFNDNENEDEKRVPQSALAPTGAQVPQSAWSLFIIQYSCSCVHYCDGKGTTKLQQLQRVFQRMLTMDVDV